MGPRAGGGGRDGKGVGGSDAGGGAVVSGLGGDVACAAGFLKYGGRKEKRAIGSVIYLMKKSMQECVSSDFFSHCRSGSWGGSR